MFRNSTGYVDRYFAQAMLLETLLHFHGHTLRLILAEGDSTDETWQRLSSYRVPFEVDLFKREHGGPVFGPVNEERRWRQISYVCDGILERVGPADDALIYVESDLLWQPATLLRLVQYLAQPGIDAVSPMAMHVSGRFYDIWGYRKGGLWFHSGPPYHPEIAPDARGLTAIESAGSCIVMRGAVARACRFRPPQEAIVGFCHDMRAHGYQLWLDTTVRTEHP